MDHDEQIFFDLTRDLDLDAFWEENDRCWDLTPSKPRCPLIFSPDDHWLFEFMHVPSTLRYYQDKDYRDQLHRDANTVLLQYVGRTFFDEDTWVSAPKRIENLFGSEFEYTEGDGRPGRVCAHPRPRRGDGSQDMGAARRFSA